MMNFFRDFVKDERSQGILEHTWAVGFVVLLGLVVLSSAGSGMQTIWASGNAVLAAANTAAG